MSKYPSVGWKIKNAAGAVLEDNQFDSSATTYSQWYSLDDAKYVGIALDCGTVTGTTPICTVSFETRFGGNAVTYILPDGANSVTCAAPTATFSTTTNSYIEYWENPLPSSGQKGQFRIKFVVSGTSPVFPWDQAILWKVSR